MCIDCTFIGARYAYYVMNTCQDMSSALVHLTRRVAVHDDVTAFCLTGIGLLSAEYSARLPHGAHLTFARKSISPPGLAGKDAAIDLICRCLQIAADGEDIINLVVPFVETHTLTECIDFAAVVGVLYCNTLHTGPKYMYGSGSGPVPDVDPICNN